MAPEWQCPKCEIVYAKYNQPPPHPPVANVTSYSSSVSSPSNAVGKFVKLSVLIALLAWAAYGAYSKFSWEKKVNSKNYVFYFDENNQYQSFRDGLAILDRYEVNYEMVDIAATKENKKFGDKMNIDEMKKVLKKADVI